MVMKRDEAKELEAVDDRLMCLLTRGGNYIVSTVCANRFRPLQWDTVVLAI